MSDLPRLGLMRSYYSAPLALLKGTAALEVLGTMAKAHAFSLDELQRDSWLHEILFFQRLEGLEDAHVILEYYIPRMGKRVDAVLVFRRCILVVEFKVGAHAYERDALNQVLDYCLDLKNFHAASEFLPIVPVLVATHGPRSRNTFAQYPDGVWEPVRTNGSDFVQIAEHIADNVVGTGIDVAAWERAGYRPTPTIIEAAQALYGGHSVREISRSDAANISTTTSAISGIIEDAKSRKRKAICFVTGVPGSGKTLAGLNLATERSLTDRQEHAVFLSGNGPLVRVLQEALARDQVANSAGTVKKDDARRRTRGFIQNIHHFRDEALRSAQAPVEKVVIFDEAQRAWDLTQTAKFMAAKKGIPDFDRSEPEFLIEVMDRHVDWAVIVCLVGGGQEINTGEAGLPEWFRACGQRFTNWDVHVSDVLRENEFSQGIDLYAPIAPQRLNTDRDLHLATSLRSFRSESLSSFVKALLDVDIITARQLLGDLEGRYPIVVSRDLDRARAWVRQQARGTERYGLLASSGGLRLRPRGIDVRHEIDPVHYFLNSASDIRSSYHLEDVATEFDAQGLELDWAVVGWDADLRLRGKTWSYHSFRGTVWQSIRDTTRQRYLKNAYRVLLTRCRQGMVIYVPMGDSEDITRAPSLYDNTYKYLAQLGLPEL